MGHPTDVDPATNKMLEFKVEDTGKGISSEYLRTKLYTRMSCRPVFDSHAQL